MIREKTRVRGRPHIRPGERPDERPVGQSDGRLAERLATGPTPVALDEPAPVFDPAHGIGRDRLVLTRHVPAEPGERGGRPAAGAWPDANVDGETPPEPAFEATVRYIVRGLAPDAGRYGEAGPASSESRPASGDSADR